MGDQPAQADCLICMALQWPAGGAHGHFQILGSILSCVRGHISPYHLSEGKGSCLLGCGSTVDLKLFLLQSIIVPSLHYGCEFWGMRIPQACGAAKKARTALQLIYDKYLGHIYGVKCTTPSAMLLEGLLLLPLHVFQWQRTLEF
jgi:hypothetical protein